LTLLGFLAASCYNLSCVSFFCYSLEPRTWCSACTLLASKTWKIYQA